MSERTSFERYVEECERRDPDFRDQVEHAKREMFGDDDGLGGVREPRRPSPTSGSGEEARP